MAVRASKSTRKGGRRKRVGRPSLPKRLLLRARSFRVELRTLEILDARAARDGTNRSEALRQIVEESVR